MESEQHAARENARTPMHWTNETNAGFTKSEPWIELNPNFATGVNVADQEKEDYSVLNYFRKMTKIRKENPTLIYGSYELLHPENEEIYAYLRHSEEDRFLVILSFANETVTYSLPGHVTYNRITKVISNNKILDESIYKEFMLSPYQAVVYRLEN